VTTVFGGIRVSRLGEADVDAAAAILFDAFGAVYRRRGHTPPFPTRDSAAWLCRAYMDLDPQGCLVAGSGAATVGVAFAHPRGDAVSIGPLAARPGAPAGVARALMGAVATLAGNAVSSRLFQDSFNPDSFGLYARLGYAVVDVAPYLLTEHLVSPPATSRDVRPLRDADLADVCRYDLRRTAADRRPDLSLLSSTGAGFVAEKAGDVGGYLFYRSLPARVVIGPGVAESAETMAELLDHVAAALAGRAAVIRASAASPAVLLRAFARGFRVDHLGNLMVSGTYAAPPAQLYALFPESL
jgi:GNAT acetyltransferase-like protein